MHDKIIARRHNSYRLKAGTVLEVDPGKGALMHAGLGPATMEKVSMDWDHEDRSDIVRRWPVEVQPGQRLYALMAETGVSVHPDRPVFLFNSGNGQKHREINAPSIQSRMALAAGRLPVLLAIIVAAAFIAIYEGRSDGYYHDIVMGLSALVAALFLAWAGLMIHDVRQNRRRAERLEDEQSAAKEAVDAMNMDIAERIAAAQALRQAQDAATPREGADG